METWRDMSHSLKLKCKAWGKRKSIFSTRKKTVERERGREKEKPKTSLFDLRSFADRILLGRDLKCIALTRATRGYKKKEEGFHPKSKG